MGFFNIDHVAFEIVGYAISSVELIATVFGLLSVYLASRANILTWPTGLINELFLFVLFFQVQLYADMFLQVYFFVVTIYGWYNWKKKPRARSISSLNFKSKILLAVGIFFGTWISGFLIGNIHYYLPEYFEVEAAYPFADSLVLLSSIAAIILLAKKKIENWYLWIIVNLVCIYLFFKKEIVFLGLEYVVFLGLAIYGYFNWKKQMNND